MNFLTISYFLSFSFSPGAVECILVGSSLVRKYMVRVTGRGKHSSLLRNRINLDRKSFVAQWPVL
jgi:hypothetical protein